MSIRRQKSQPFGHPLIPRQKFRDGILRDVFLEINIYIRARAPVCACMHQHITIARPSSSCHFMRFGSDAIIWCRIAIFEFPSWSIHRADHLLGLMPRIWNSFSLSLPLSLFVHLSFRLSRCVFSTLITNFDNIRSRSVNICMQNAGRGLYFLHKTRALENFCRPLNGAIHRKYIIRGGKKIVK